MKEIWHRENLIYSLILAAYFLLLSFSKEIDVFSLAVALIFLSIAFLNALIKNKYIRIIINLGSCLIIFLLFSQIKNIFIFIPIFLVNLLSELFDYRLAILGILLVVLLEKDIRSSYILIYTLYFTAMFINEFYSKTLKNLKDREIELERENIKLRDKITRSSDLQKEMDFNIRLEERTRLSQKLHDMLGHSLSGALMQIEASKLVLKKNQEEGIKLLDSSTEIIRSGIDSIRAVLRESKPDVYEVGFSELKTLLKKVESQSGIKTEFNVTGDVSKIDSRIMSMIFSNVEEAISNTIKHSKAKNFKVQISSFKKVVKLYIVDDGIGFKNLNESMGISGMRDRVQKLGGSLNITSDKGFIINVLIPLKEE